MSHTGLPLCVALLHTQYLGESSPTVVLLPYLLSHSNRSCFLCDTILILNLLILNMVLLEFEYVLLPVPKGSPVVYFGGAVARESGLELYRLLIINPPGSLGFCK